MDTLLGVKRFVEQLEAQVREIDIVLLNAGCFSVNYDRTADGWERDLQVNVLATTLLALLMLKWMRGARREPGQEQHLGIVGSGVHLKVEITGFPKRDILKYFNEEKNYKGAQLTYGMSKLLVQYAANEVAKLAVLANGGAAVKVITSEEGKKMQATVWKEIIDVLVEKVPEVREIVYSKL